MNNMEKIIGIRQNRIILFIVFYLFGLLLILLSFTAFHPNKAYAAYENGNGYPADVITRLNDYCNTNLAATPNASAQTTWLSLANNLNSNSTTINAGDSVQLRLNIVTKRCSNNNTVLIGDRFRPIQTYYVKNNAPFEVPELTGAPYNDLVVCPPDLPPKGSLIGCPQSSVQNNYSRESWVFSISSNGITPNASGYYDVSVFATTKQFSWRSVEANFLCIQGAPQPSMDYEVEVLNQSPNDVMMNKCTSTTVQYGIRLFFQGPTLGIENTCKGIKTTFSGSRADVAGPSGFIGSIPTSGGELDLISKGINSGTTLDVTAIGTGVNTTKSHTWVPPANCPFVLSPTGSAIFNDDENPEYVDFGDIGANMTNGTRSVKNVTITRVYYIKKFNNATIPLSDPDPSSLSVTVPTSGYRFPSDPANPNKDRRSISGLSAGDKACVKVTLIPGSGDVDSSGTIISSGASIVDEFCDTVVSKPYVTFFGSDVMVGKGFYDASLPGCTTETDTLTPTRAGTVRGYNKRNAAGQYAGSSVQLAINAVNAITEVNSASVRGDTPNYLSFANTDGSEFGGNFGASSRCIRNYFAGFNPADATVNPPELNDSFVPAVPNVIKHYEGDLTINRSTDIPIGARWTIYVKGNVFIKNNIEYAVNGAGWANRTEIPSLYLIVEGNIFIADNVTQLDGIYVAQPSITPPIPPVTGSIFTCTKADGTTYDISQLYANCQTKLTVFGSFIAQKIHLDRTANSIRDGQLNETWQNAQSAETFIYSPEAYIVEPNLPVDSTETNGIDYFTTLQPIL